jgi:hydrogenase maturation protein HypF
MRPLATSAEVVRRLSVEVRVRGRVQGVGFRPTVWRLARELELCGEVLNDSEGVVIRASGDAAAVAALLERLRTEAPPQARIDQIEARPVLDRGHHDFRIATTGGGMARTQVAPDAVICRHCAREIADPSERRHRYAFATCTHCGPRLSIVTGIPYDRDNTTMMAFAMCEACRAEYRNPADRRFHAETIACHECGPRPKLVHLRADGFTLADRSVDDPVAVASEMLAKGFIIAVKGLGGYQLACDATDEGAVLRLRRAKLRQAKPFALMGRDLDIIRRYCAPSAEDERQLVSSEGPIVLLHTTGPHRLPDAVAPGLRTLGFMLPTTPLHHLLLAAVDRPVVMTSGNLSEEPQIIDDAMALEKLCGIADAALAHDRKIAIRIDDSIVRVMQGTPRLFRRARGYAPTSIKLPPGFAGAADVLAFGGDLKSTFCLIKGGEAVLSQHQGDMENAATFDDLRRNLAFYAELIDHAPEAVATDQHPEYRSAKLAREHARHKAVPLIEVQHHHAHVASCLAENGRPFDAPAVLGIVLDGLGWGGDGTWWGGEFLLADYCRAERLGTFKPVAMVGADQAAREPWRNLYAHLTAEMGWAEFAMNFAELELYRYLDSKPRPLLDQMIRRSINAPLASSCGRLFDAVAAALGICRDRQMYEGEAASRLEAITDDDNCEGEEAAYPFAIPSLPGSALPYIEPLPMWKAVLGDLTLATPVSVMAGRFHRGLARAIVAMTKKLARDEAGGGPRFDTVALSGGCFQNAVLFDQVVRRLEAEAFTILTHSKVPANDGGLALGQAAIAAARLIGTAQQ